MFSESSNMVSEQDSPLEKRQNELEKLDVTDPTVCIQDHLSLFDIYLDSLSSTLSLSLSNFIRSPIAISAHSPTVVKFDPISRHDDQPAFDRMYRFPSLQGIVAVIAPAGLVFRFVDVFFGGTGELVGEQTKRKLSAAEINMLDKVSADAIDAIVSLLKTETSSDGLTAVEPWSHQKAAQSGRTESMVAIKFTALIASYEEQMEIWFSLSVLELLLGAKLLPRKDGSLREPQWSTDLKTQIFDCQLELKCALADQSMPLKHVSKLSIGDFIPMAELGEATFSAESKPLFRAKVGVTNDKASASFIEWI